jgi:hypothetical protein
MDEHTELEGQSGGMDRRDFVKRSAILGGMVWAAPAVSSLGSRAFAQAIGSPDVTGECDYIVRFKWSPEGGFESCGTGGDCYPEGYDNAAYPCVAPDGSFGLAGKSLVATIIDEYTVEFEITPCGADCELHLLTVKGGSGDNSCVEFDFTADETKKVQVSSETLLNPGGQVPGVSHIAGIFCCVVS